MRRISCQRAAFTLAELLVVIAIIVALAALGLGAASKGYGWIKQRSTETTMTKIIERLTHRRLPEILKDARDWSLTSALSQQSSGDPGRAEVLKIKYLTKWSFPTTYAEAFHNVQESRILYEPRNGYAPAVAILNKLRTGCPIIPDPFTVPAANLLSDNDVTGSPRGPNWAGGTVAPGTVPRQNAACLLAIFHMCTASSADELASMEFSQDTSAADKNPFFIDAWGNSLFFLRNGNVLPGWTMGMINGNPLPAILGESFTTYLANRASGMFPRMQSNDPDDPENLLVSGAVPSYYPTMTGVSWLTSRTQRAGWRPPRRMPRIDCCLEPRLAIAYR